MIEARFDDLVPGAERAFRMVEPVGVLEARTAGRGAGVIEAAEAAAARGLWVAGFVAYDAAPGLDPGSRSGRPTTRSRSCRSRGSRCSNGGAGPAARAAQLGPPRHHRVAVASLGRPPDLRRGDRPDPRADRRGPHLPGELHAPPPRPHRGGRARPLPRPRARPAGRVRRAPRPRPVPRALGLARALLPHRRRTDHDAADEGHGAARPLARGGRGDGRAARRLGGACRERDDRRPAPQRPRPRLPRRLGRGGAHARGRTVRDRVAATSTIAGNLRPGRRSSTSSGRCSRAAR